MPRTSIQHPPKYSRHKASGQAVVTLSGLPHYLGKYNSKASRDEYQRLITLWVQGGGRLDPDSLHETCVNEVILAFVEFAEGYYRKGGKVTREYGLIVEVCRAIKPLFGRTPVSDFGPLALKAVRQTLIDKGVSRKFINKQVDRVKRMFRWAAAEEIIPASIPEALTMVVGLRKDRCAAKETAPILPVDDEIVAATLEYLPDIVRDMVRLQRLTGCRPDEICRLRPCDLDRTGDIWTYRPDSHKTEHHGRERVVLLGPKSQTILLRYLARDAKTNCFRPCDSEAKRRAAVTASRKTPPSCGNTVGTNRKRIAKRQPGESYTTDSYRRAIHRGCDKAFPAPDGTKGGKLRNWQSEHRWSPGQPHAKSLAWRSLRVLDCSRRLVFVFS